MRKLSTIVVCALVGLVPLQRASAQVAGTQTLGVTVEEMKVVVLGWSVRHKMLGQPVHNDRNEKIGSIDDVIVSPDRKLSWAIVGVGGFLGLGKHDVAIPIEQLRFTNDRFILPRATKEALKALPTFEYAKR